MRVFSATAIAAVGWIFLFGYAGAKAQGPDTEATQETSGEAELIPREVLFAGKAKVQPQISPDGARLAYLAPDRMGFLNVWVETLGRGDAAPVTAESGRPIKSFRWSEDGEQLLYLQDSDGNELWHLYSVHLATRAVHDLTPYRNVRASNLLTSPKRPREILIGLNLRDSQVQDMYRVNLVTRQVQLDTANPGDVLSWTADQQFVIRGATAFDPPSGKTMVRVRDAADRPWRAIVSWTFEDSLMFGQSSGGSAIVAFSADGSSLFVVSAQSSDTGRLVEVDAHTGAELRPIAQHARSDVAMDPDAFPDTRPLVIIDAVTRRIQAVAFEHAQWEWRLLDSAFAAEWSALGRLYPGFLRIVSRDRADSQWILSQVTDDRPERFYLYDRKSKQTRPLFADSSELQRYETAHQRPVELSARDGQRLIGYLTLPVGARRVEGAAHAVPMVLIPHGGPWDRDHWGYDPLVQFLANRGYAVLQVNFRGSTGFGKKFLNAGDHQFGLAMQDDLTDAVSWAVRESVADPKRVAILGFSAGGYATLRGLTRTPELYSCGVDVVGPADLRTSFAAFPPWWNAVKARWVRRVGDVERDERLNQALSPLHEADRIRVPLLIAQGANDARVSIRNSDLMVSKLRRRNQPVTYIVYPDEGHGFARPANQLDFYGRVEVFLKHCLGGRAQPWRVVSGSTAQVY